MYDEKLVTDNLRLVYYLYEKLGKSDFVKQNKDDLISEGMMGLIKAAKSYVCGKSKFATYASRCIMNQMLMHLRRQKHWGREVSLDAPLSVDESGRVLTYADVIPDERSHMESCIAAADVEIKFKRFYKDLPKTQKQILKLRYEGLRQKQIANKMSLSQSYVSRLLRKMKAAYKKAA